MTGTATRKAARQENASSSAPPITGPRPVPTEMPPDQMPTAMPRCRGSANVAKISPRVAGIWVAAARPSTARHPIISAGSEVLAAISETTAKTAAPAISSRRWPILSPSVPMVTSRPAIRNP